VVVLAAIAAGLLRQRGVASWRTVWAEDGSIYAQQAIRDGGFHSLFHSYSGYLQLPARLIALATPILPVRSLAVYMAIAGSTILALGGLFVFHMSRGWIESRSLRLALAALFVIMPILGRENTANVTNTIWLFAAVAPWALLSLEEGRLDTVLRAIVVFLAATATALCIVFVPVAVGWALIRRTRSAVAVAVAFGVGLAVQGIVILTAPAPDRFANSLTAVPRVFAVRVVAMLVVGPSGVSALWPDHGGLLIAGCVVVLGGLFVLLVPGARSSSRWLAGVFVALAIATFLLPVLGRGTSLVPVEWGQRFNLTGARFSVIPLLMLSSSLAVLLAGPATHRARQIVGWARPVFIAQAALLIVIGFSVTTPRSVGPSWPGSVDAAATRCTGQPPDHLIAVIENARNPFAPTFLLIVPCSTVVQGS
jgi:hypothetical protein